MEILVHQPSEVEIGHDNYEVLNPINFHNMYLSIKDKYDNSILDISDESYLKGYIKVKTAYQYAIDFLESIYADYGLHINMTDSDPYYEFEDLNIQNGCAVQWGGSNPGMSLSQMRNVTLWPNGNTLKSAKYWKDGVKFNELALFTRLTEPTKQGVFREMPLLEEIDCTNLTKMTENFLWKCPNLKKVGATLDNELPNLRYMDRYVFNYDPIEKISIPRLYSTKIECCFYQCKELREAHIDGPYLNEIGYELFYQNTALETVTGFSNVTKISSNAFKGCTSLQHVDNIGNVTEFGESCFNGCGNMDFDLSKARIIYNWAFNSSGITIANLSSIQTLNPCFQYCNNLREVYLNEEYTNYTLAGGTFYQSRNLERINLDNCKVIGSDAFRDCTSLQTVGNTANLTKFEGQQNFYNTPALQSINLSNVINIPNWCFGYSGVKTLGDITNIQKIAYNAFYESGITGDLTFTNLEILGSQVFRHCVNLTSLDLGPLCTYIETTDQRENWRDCTSLKTFTANIDKVGYLDFYNCTSLETVNLPEVTSIGSDSFNGCTSLTTINIPKAITTASNSFRNTGIVNFTLPLLETVGYECFRDNTALETINLPSVKTISQYAFYNCKNLTSVAEMPLLETIGNGAFYNCKSLIGTINISNVISIGEWAFEECQELSNVILNSNTVSIGMGAFCHCYNLRSINTEGWEVVGRRVMEDCGRVTELNLSNLKRIETNNNNEGQHFRGMTALTTVTSLENLEYVKGNDVFYNCVNLVTAPISNKLTSVPAYFFQNCKKLENVGDLSGLTSVGRQAFDYCEKMNYSGDLSGVTYLDTYAFRHSGIGPTLNLPNWSTYQTGNNDHRYFQYCPKIVTANVPSLTVIPDGCFEFCDLLESITFSDELTQIGNYAFQYDYALNNVDLPATVTKIGYYAFGHCTALKTFTCRAMDPPVLGENNIFDWTSPTVIYVPEDAVTAYKTATYWKNYNIQAIPS